MRDAAGATGSLARRLPRLVVTDDGPRLFLATTPLRDHPEDDSRVDLPGLLQSLVFLVLRHEQRPQVHRYREHLIRALLPPTAYARRIPAAIWSAATVGATVVSR